jgi:hypothetical protein
LTDRDRSIMRLIRWNDHPATLGCKPGEMQCMGEIGGETESLATDFTDWRRRGFCGVDARTTGREICG